MQIQRLQTPHQLPHFLTVLDSLWETFNNLPLFLLFSLTLHAINFPRLSCPNKHGAFLTVSPQFTRLMEERSGISCYSSLYSTLLLLYVEETLTVTTTLDNLPQSLLLFT